MKHKFVEFIPNKIEDDTLYISVAYNTAIHNCFCGCGNEVVTPLAPTKWRFSYDGLTISLSPSIGSWELPCQSHYWIYEGQVVWAGKWSKRQIENASDQDLEDIKKYYDEKNTKTDKRNL